MKEYRRGRYQVRVEDNGAIKVRSGDWLSKYSAAINNNFFSIHEFGRMGRSGQIEPVQNPNLIQAGETLYHIPTHNAFAAKGGIPKPPPPTPHMSEAEKERRTIEHLKGEFHLQGQHLHWLHTAHKIIEGGSTAMELAEIAGLIAEGGAVAGGATVLQFASAVLLPIYISVEVLNANEIGTRMFGMQAVAYTTTAWAFGDAMPGPSATMMKRFKGQYGEPPLPGYRQAWENSSRATTRNLEEFVVKKRVQKKSYQVLLRAIGDDNRKALCLRMLKGFEEEFREGSQRDFWKFYYDVEYPS